jgi:hypothetical protein
MRQAQGIRRSTVSAACQAARHGLQVPWWTGRATARAPATGQVTCQLTPAASPSGERLTMEVSLPGCPRFLILAGATGTAASPSRPAATSARPRA